MFEFGAPAWLILLPLPLLAWRFRRRQSEDVLIHPLTALIGTLHGSGKRSIMTHALWLAGCALLIVAMAQPRWLDSSAATLQPGHNIVFAIDVSGSMRALDYTVDDRRISRLDMVKQSLQRFLHRSGELRAAIIVFADEAFTLLPLTHDLALAAEMSAEIDNSLAGERTAIGSAVALAVERLERTPGEARILVLLSDGTDTGGAVRPDDAAELARARGVRIHTVVFGRTGSVPFPLGNGEVVYRELPPDSALLESLAQRTGGDHFSVREASDMDAILERIHAMEKTRIPVPAQARPWYWLPATLGLLCLFQAEYGRRREATAR